MVILVCIIILIVSVMIGVILHARMTERRRQAKAYERSLKMVPLLIHLPPETDDIKGNGRDERDVTNEAISRAGEMYAIVASTVKKGYEAKIYGQRHSSFEIVAKDGIVKYYAVVPTVLVETVKQAIVTAYPTARVEETDEENVFSRKGGIGGVTGAELTLKKDYIYPIATYEETRWDVQKALLNAMSKTGQDEGMAVQILYRPAKEDWTQKSLSRVQEIRDGGGSKGGGKGAFYTLNDVIRAPLEVPEAREAEKKEKEPLTQLQQEEMAVIENKTKYPGFEVAIRLIASSHSKARSDALLQGVVAAFSQFNSPQNNGFEIDILKDEKKLVKDYVMRFFSLKNSGMILNSIEMASLFHLPSQSSIPSSGVERQLTKQVDGPAKLAETGLLLGVNEYRGVEKPIRLTENDRRRHVYVIGATGMGKSVLLKNLAYQDMMEGRGFAFIDPHGDVTEELLSMVPEERIDDVIYFDPGDMENPMGMNMFEYETPDQKDFIVQEGINMLYSLYDPGHTGIFGPRGEHMFRNAALLLMSDPNGATFIDIPRCFIDPEFVKSKLKYVTDRYVYDYWTKEFPQSQKSNDAGEVVTWLVSKWSPFLQNMMMRNILGQTKSAFRIREVMDEQKILLVNLSKGKLGELNSKLLGMIFVMKFQAAAMGRVDTPEDKRKDFSLFVDEFQNFSTESFESILSEARKFRLNLIVANQFMTQLSDKIREGVLGNVGTIIAGRVGVTDAELLEKVFAPTFTTEDLHNQPNYHAITQVMMFNMPTRPFTMKLLPPMGVERPEVMESLRAYSAAKYGRPRAEVNREIEARLSGSEPMVEATKGRSFLESWEEKKAEILAEGSERASEGGVRAKVGEKAKMPENGVVKLR